MSNFITKSYRTYIPKSLRDYLYNLFLEKLLTFFRSLLLFIRCKFSYCLSYSHSFKNDRFQAWASLGKYGKSQYPGIDILKYKKMDIEVFINESNKLPYVMHSNKKLYFPLKYENRIPEIYKTLLIEQEENSAHRYVKSYNVFNGKTILDIGASEGFIPLNVIEMVDFVYFFECDEDWIEVLSATFEPWKDKVQVIRKYVSDKDSDIDNLISLDTFMKDKSIDNLFIKMDIEGAELDALNGASDIFDKAKNLDFSICTYHYENDKIEIPAFLDKYKCKYEFTNGYLFISWCLRKGVVRSC